MKKQKIIAEQRRRRRGHVRNKTRGLAARPRLTVFRSNRHIAAQIIDDEAGKTLVAASTLQDAVAEGLKSKTNKDAAKRVGKLLAERAAAAGVTAVCFDRGHYRYHGRVAALADAAREAGLKF